MRRVFFIVGGGDHHAASGGDDVELLQGQFGAASDSWYAWALEWMAMALEVGPEAARLLATDTFNQGWEAQVTFQLCFKCLFALSAFPFMVFEIPGLDTLISHTRPSGYNENGVCVPEDNDGLSAYTHWLSGRLRSRAVAREMSAVNVRRLTEAVDGARAYLRKHPDASRKRTLRRRDELEGILSSLVPPTHPLYEKFFPDRVICQRLEKRLTESGQLQVTRKQAKAREHGEDKGAKYGIEWQRDDASAHCRLCAEPFSAFRRRHHCRLCGQLVCDYCSRARRVVKGSSRPKRVCSHCVLRASASALEIPTRDAHEDTVATTQTAVTADSADSGGSKERPEMMSAKI